MKHRTKIVCTIGPASSTQAILKKMIRAGMDVARLNFSHGEISEHRALIKNIRLAEAEVGRPIAIMQDLPGLKFRVGNIGVDGIEVTRGETVVLSPKSFIHEKHKVIPIGLGGFYKEVKKGFSILFGDGMIELKVMEVSEQTLTCKVRNSGTILPHQGINVPALKSKVPTITQDDISKLEFGIKQDVDFVALSFVRNKDDIIRLRRVMEKIGLKNSKSVHRNASALKIIAKIEKQEALENFDEILEVSDAIMIARGDLGVESPLEKLPVIQKEIIQKCLDASKPVITATQMLLSMVRNPRPTRSETSDVANAVVDHTDAVMLSEETARGKYPVEAVTTMAKIIVQAEKSPFDDLEPRTDLALDKHLETLMSNTAFNLTRGLGAKAIFVASLSGETARVVSKFRPEVPIIVATHSKKVERQMALSWSVVPLSLPVCRSVDELISRGTRAMIKQNLAKKGDRVVIVAGQPVGEPGNVNMVKVHRL